FPAPAVRFNLAQTFELADAMINVHNKIAGLQVRKIAEESRRANLLAGSLNARKHVEQIGIAIHRERCIRKGDAFPERRANQHESRRFRGTLCAETSARVL